jgi:hypothetical protein
MASPTNAMVHIDRPLSNFAVSYKNTDLIGRDVIPFVTVQKKSDSYMTYEKKDAFTVPETVRGPTDTANSVDWAASTGSYSCVDHALNKFTPDAIAANADPGVDMRRRTTEMLTDLILLGYEQAVATLVTTAGNYSGQITTLTGGDQWSSYATSDPLGNIETARAGCFYAPKICVMGYEVWAILKQHPQILDRVSGGATNASPAQVTKALVAELFEVDQLLVGNAKINLNNYAQTASYTRIWGKDVVMAYTLPTPTLDDASAWKSFQWRQLTTNMGYQTRTWQDPTRGGGGEVIEVETSYNIKAVASDNKYLIDAVIA